MPSSRRLPLTVLVAAAGAGLASVPAVASAAPTASTTSTSVSRATSVGTAPRLGATLERCGTGVAAADRSATFRAAMPRRTGAARLWMRFDLERRAPRATGWTRVAAPTFGRWQKSRAGVAGFVYTKRVEGLDAPAQYRAVVRFRWRSSSGRTLRSATRTTRVCTLADPRPDLGIVSATPLAGAIDVTVANRGRSRTPAPTSVVAAGAAGPVAFGSVPVLEAGESTTVRLLVGPCEPSGTFDLTVDPADGVEEADEDDNSRTVACFT